MVDLTLLSLSLPLPIFLLTRQETVEQGQVAVTMMPILTAAVPYPSSGELHIPVFTEYSLLISATVVHCIVN